MNYKRIYKQIVDRAKNRKEEYPLKGYKEKHHVIPRSMGGNDDDSNMVELTAREHLLAHWLLWKIFKTPNLELAYHKMAYGGKTDITGQKKSSLRQYEKARIAFSKRQKGTDSLEGAMKKRHEKIIRENEYKKLAKNTNKPTSIMSPNQYANYKNTRGRCGNGESIIEMGRYSGYLQYKQVPKDKAKLLLLEYLHIICDDEKPSRNRLNQINYILGHYKIPASPPPQFIQQMLNEIKQNRQEKQV